MSMDVDLGELKGFVAKLGNAVESDYTLVAAGGTALSLYGIKKATVDIDFVVASGDLEYVYQLTKTLTSRRVDYYPDGMVFITSLPSDYVSRSVDFGTFGRVKLLALHLADVILTKTARGSDSDMGDIRACADFGCRAEDIIDAMYSYRMDLPYMRNNVRRVLREIFNLGDGDLAGCGLD